MRVPAVRLWQDEERRRAKLRKAIFPDLPSNTFIFANFNQHYKIDPVIFATWLRILEQVPQSVLWLLRFPAAGEENLMRTARTWAGKETASRIRFTDVANKDAHIRRCRVADLFLDTVECSAHTVAADVLWAGTPIVTWPEYRYKMCSRVGASVAYATGFGSQMVVSSVEEYEERAISLASSLRHHTTSRGQVRGKDEGELVNLRRSLYLNRDHMPLFDTERWTRNLEKGLREVWKRWVGGTEFQESEEWKASTGPEKESGCIWIEDNDPITVRLYE